MTQPLPPPVVDPERSLPEITVKAVILGIVLAMLLAAANAYIGLLVGMTVSASIPAAAVSLGLLRLFRRSNILENNMVQTAASAGESLVAGIIFTIPALVMMGAWQGYLYWPMVAIAIVGGVLGVSFTIPLRRALIVEARLRFPEGVATAEVLKTGGVETDRSNSAEVPQDQSAASGFRLLVQAAGLGGLFKLMESGLGLLAGGVTTVKSGLGGHYLFSGGMTLSPALIGVGYIVGLNIAVLVFLGGVIGTLIGVPVNWLLSRESILVAAGIDSTLALEAFTPQQWAAIAAASWQKCRYIGVGAMMVGGLWSLVALAKPLASGIRASLSAYRASKTDGAKAPSRTETDTPFQLVILVALVSIIPLFFIFYLALGDYQHKLMVSALMTLLMLVLGFIFSSVAGYMAGLVGSSNNPISGVTIATVITSALILVTIMGKEGVASTLGPIAVIYLAALICSSAAIAGDNMQDLKCGHVVGATPWRQQLFQVIGVIAAALLIPLVLDVLDAGYGIGRPAAGGDPTKFLAAPQAGLMMTLATGIFGSGIEWHFILMGCALAVLLILLDRRQERRGAEFRFPVLAVAVGIYLPLGLSVPIFIGGLLADAIRRGANQVGATEAQARSNRGVLLASGLITGEALMGVVIAIYVAFIGQPGTAWQYAGLAGVASLMLICVYLYRQTIATKP
ncbi:putative oligopeptide transporter, OPT family [Ferrimonas sediminum]|uniref:Putative oligopeptide transporter, OPT family n=1 Tax=Ferrimonas sediminum TaxID=718193 RepID=A0A1G8SGK8_9GAMM|nr:oligopeptide transporter, OPT family [Ferrimonas sediminum]SDJ28341.1 putative oligopeptide transporter, OPT family [Ferrimonas sediminum]